MLLEDFTIPPPEQPLTDWREYYEWRGFSLDSPVAQLLHYCLTIYHVIQVCLHLKAVAVWRQYYSLILDTMHGSWIIYFIWMVIFNKGTIHVTCIKYITM